MKACAALAVLALLLPLQLTAAAVVRPQLGRRSKEQSAKGRPVFVPNEVLVEVQPGAALPKAGMGAVGLKQVKSFQSAGIERFKIVDGTAVATKVESLNKMQGVTAQPNFIYYPTTTTPNDEYFPKQWSLHSIAAPDAWDITKGSEQIKVCVIDSGYTFHPDLDANINKTASYNAVEIEGENDPANFADGAGHGTHVAGTIGAVTNNGIGVAGVAWKVQLHVCRFLSNEGSGTTMGAITCLHKCREWGVHMSSNSWGSSLLDQTDKLLYKEIKQDLQEGRLFVAAAGNSGADTTFNPEPPAAYNLDNVISVASSTIDDTLSYFSNYGQRVDIAAPGSSVLSTFNYSSPSAHYAVLSGTSMATPHVTGAAVLLQAQALAAGGKLLTPLEIKERLKRTADKNACLAPFIRSGGRLNLAAALQNRKSNKSPDCFLLTLGVRISKAKQRWGDCRYFTSLLTDVDPKLTITIGDTIAFTYAAIVGVDWDSTYFTGCSCVSTTEVQITLVAQTAAKSKAQAIRAVKTARAALSKGSFTKKLQDAYSQAGFSRSLWFAPSAKKASLGACVESATMGPVWGTCPNLGNPTTKCNPQI